MPTFSMPLYVELGKRKIKRYYLNLNNYRNWHYQVSNNVKIEYTIIAGKQIDGFVFNYPIKLSFNLWKRDKRKLDRANQLCIHEKFFCDALHAFKCITDDNDKYIESTHYYTGGIDKDNPRVDIKIEEIKR